MAIRQKNLSIFHELANLFASSPSRKQLVEYHPPARLQQKALNLLAKQGEGRLSNEEQHELDEFVHAEILMRLVKAKARAHKTKP